MEKQSTDYKPTEKSTSDGLNQDRGHESGFKYNIPEAEAGFPNNQPQAHQYDSEPSPHTSGIVLRKLTGSPGPTPTPTPTAQNRGANMGDQLGTGVRGVFAAIHGAGEWLRGGVNAAVDRAFGSEEGVTRNKAISQAGQQEIRSGNFTGDTHNSSVWERGQKR
ncbi:hypothetical protein BJX99DRAFT_254526 [Aspergillus californicus]